MADALVSARTVARLATSPEPAARWVALAILAAPAAGASVPFPAPPADDVARAHADVMADPLTADILARLSSWESPAPISGHDRPEFAPNLLGLLADMGVTAADDSRIAATHAAMLAHQADDGRFLAATPHRGKPAGVWAALPCDAHAILETLARAGHTDDPRVVRAFDHLTGTITPTTLGPAWRCVPDPLLPFRGPGRVADPCPQVTLEGLRTYSYLPPERRPAVVDDVARTSLNLWRQRATAKPYMFGHGRQFKRGKWPATWYSAFAVVDTLGRFPHVWSGSAARPEDRRAMAELAACLIAYTMDDDGRVVPSSTYRGWEAHSFGQKKVPSDFATARIAVALARLEPIAAEVRAVDVAALGSSKGGSGTPLPP